MRRIISALLLCVLCTAQSFAVLKEKDLARTLGVLKAELQVDYEKQQAFMAMYEQQGTQQHHQLVSYMQQCEQIGLMLFSQNVENTFDMAYACQQATTLYRQLNRRNGKMMQYDRIIAHLGREIERYDALIASLKSMPPVTQDADEALTESDTILLQAIDSLENARRFSHQPKDETDAAQPAPSATDTPAPPAPDAEADEAPQEPLYLRGQQLRDREDCLVYAQTLRDNMQQFLETMQAESTYYQSVRDKVERLNEFAQSRYKILQDNIFRNGTSNYFSMLSTLPRQIARAQRSVKNKYEPFKGHESNFSEWRGAYVLFISVFVVLYLFLALALSYVFLRWLLPKRWRGEDFRLKRQMLNNVVGIGLFAIFVMVVRTFAHHNIVRMGTGLIINMAWLMEVIFLSLYIRLRGEQMRHAVQIYMPLLFVAFLVIMFRIVLVPNIIVNLVYPPLLLLFTVWQLWSASRHRAGLPMLDMIYTHITSATMVITCVAAWGGYSLLAVQIMIWWTFQLAAIMTITCIYDLMEMYENRVMVLRIRPDLKERLAAGDEAAAAEAAALRSEMRTGRYIGKTWLYDLVNRTLVPILGVLSVLFSIYWAAKVFEMTSVCYKVFMMDIIYQKGFIRISLFNLCLVASLWFVFRYLNYCIRSTYVHYRRQMLRGEGELNFTLAKNVIAILVWGLYLIIALFILEVPKSGISIVTAGLATGLGFAMQDLIENFFYGISLMTGRLHVGDYIECDGIQGKVESITYQSTQIVTPDGCVIAFLNNALFRKNFKNMTRNHRYELIKIPVGVAYGTDVARVRQLLIQAITPLCREKNMAGQCVTNIAEQPLKVVFVDFGESSVDLAVVVWMLVEEKIALSGRIKEVIYNTLNANNIEIPFPQRDVHMR